MYALAYSLTLPEVFNIWH